MTKNVYLASLARSIGWLLRNNVVSDFKSTTEEAGQTGYTSTPMFGPLRRAPRSDMDNAMAIARYRSLIDSHQIKAARAKSMVQLGISFATFIAGIQVAVFIAEPHPVYAINPAVSLTALAMITIAFRREKIRIRTIVNSEHIRPLASGAVCDSVTATAHHVLSILAPGRRITVPKLYIHQSAAPAPSVLYTGYTVYLLLPIGFLKTLRKEPEIAEGILAHEIAHIVQGDMFLWKYCNVIGLPFYRVILWAFCAFPFLTLIISASLSPDPSSGPFFGFLLFSLRTWSLWRAKRAIHKARHVSEFLADYAAAILVGTPTYWHILARHSFEPATLTHPARAERLHHVAQLGLNGIYPAARGVSVMRN